MTLTCSFVTALGSIQVNHHYYKYHVNCRMRTCHIVDFNPHSMLKRNQVPQPSGKEPRKPSESLRAWPAVLVLLGISSCYFETQVFFVYTRW